MNVSDVLGGKVFGYTYYSPPEHSDLIGKSHDIFFFAINSAKERVLVGCYENAVFLLGDKRKKLKAAFRKSNILDKRVEELLALGLPPIKTEKEARYLLLDQFAANIVVDPKDVHSFSVPIVLSAEMLGGRDPKYLGRYTKPLFLTARPTLPRRDAATDAIASVGADRELLEDAYLRFTKAQRKVVFRLHNQLSNRFRAWLRDVGAKNISAESEFVDVRCRLGGKDYLFELKTCYQQKTRHAIREAIGQILEYSYFPGRRLPSVSAVVLDAEPGCDEVAWCKALNASGVKIELFWLKGEYVYSAGVGDHPLAAFVSNGA